MDLLWNNFGILGRSHDWVEELENHETCSEG